MVAKCLNIQQNTSFSGDLMREKRYVARVSVALESELFEKLQDLSREKGISLAGLIRMAVREWLKSMS